MKFVDLVRRAVSRPHFTPWLYLAVCLLAYAPLIASLGFYWDDWPTIFYTQAGRTAQLFEHFSYDRPYSAWVYYLIGRLGTAPLIWHAAALLLRWAGLLAFAWALKAIWPRQPGMVLAASLLFAVYPGYLAQPLPAIFVAHLLTQGLFLLSLGLMAHALRQPSRFGVYTALAVLVGVCQAFLLEYYVGLELVRPLVIWLILREQLPGRAALQKTFKHWLAYLPILLAWGIWRLWLLDLPYEPYPLELRSHPSQTAQLLLQTGLRDLQFTFLGAWRAALQSLQTLDWLAWAVTGLLAVGLWLLLRRQPADPQSQRAAQQAGLLGLFAFLVGMAPIWVTGNELTQNEYSQRYLLIAMFGAALALAAALSWMRSQPWRVLLLAGLVALAAGSHIRNAERFRQDWGSQRTFYAQLQWRAPQIESGTAIVTPARITPWTGQPLTAYSLNTLYPVQASEPYVDLWHFESRYSAVFDSIEAGEALRAEHRGLVFAPGGAQKVLALTLAPNSCWWVLEPHDAANPYLSAEERILAQHSNPGLIVPTTDIRPNPRIFGEIGQADWCFFFQKAKLANWQALWEQTIALMSEAIGLGLAPQVDIEWLPLVEAYVNQEEWALARETSLRAAEADGDSLVCALWQDWGARSPAAAQMYNQLRQAIPCE